MPDRQLGMDGAHPVQKSNQGAAVVDAHPTLSVMGRCDGRRADARHRIGGL
jgi:hypothetical protein